MTKNKRKGENYIIVIPVFNLTKTKFYSGIKKMCEKNPGFPLRELYKRDKYPFPFFKIINGRNLLFIKIKINKSLNI